MKRQQLFNSFSLLSTTAVLATQPAWADTVQVKAVQLNPIASGVEVILNTSKTTSPPVFISSYGKTFVVDIVDTQLRLPKGNTFRASNPTDSITDITVTALNAKSIRVTVTGKAGLPLGKMAQSDKGLVISLTVTSVAQSVSPTPTSPASPSAANSDIRSRGTEAPTYLNPSSNPLQFPTRPEEVRIQGTVPITLQQTFELARRNNRQLQVAQLTLERSRAALREQQADLFPNLSIGVGITNQGSNVFSKPATISTGAGQTANQTTTTGGTGLMTVGGSDTGNSTGLSSTISSSYDIYTPGARSGRIRAAEEQVRFERLDAERLTERLRLDVSNDYYDVQAQDEQIRINQAAVTNAQASLRDAQALEQAGVGNREEVLQSQVLLANAIQNLTNAITQQQIARRQLAQTLGLSQSVDVTAVEPVEMVGLWNLTLEESIVLAFQNRAELEQQLALRDQSEQRRRSVGTLGPQLSLGTTYTFSNTLDDDDDFGDRYSIEPTVSLNLFDGGAARASADFEEANIAIAETNFANQRDLVRFEVEEASANLQSNFSNIQTASVVLEQAREALRLARLRFQAGVGTQTDVINAQERLSQAEGNRVTDILNYNRSLTNLQRAVSSGQPR